MRRLILSLFLFVVAGQVSVQPLHAQADEAGWLLSQINALRQSKGESPLVLNAQLAAAASAHCTYLSTHPWISPHVEDNGSTPSSRAWAAGYPGKLVGENVVGGATADVKWAFNWWMNSPVHLQNMLGNWQEIGIGVVQGETGRWYTLLFGSDSAGFVEPAAPAPPQQSPASSDNAPAGVANPPAETSNKVAAAPQPTHRPATRVPTATPTITPSPTITYTPRATFTPTSTSTPLPPTPTAIELEVSPQPSQGAVAVAMVTTPGDTSPKVTLLAVSPVPATDSNDSIRRLLPWLFAIQGIVVGGFVIRAIWRRAVH